MTTEQTDTFGAGIFEEASQDDAPIELTAREIAIAKGEDPDAIVEGEEQGGRSDDLQAKASGEQGGFSDSDRELAAKYGIGEDELADFGTPAALQKAVSLIERSKSTDGATNKSSSDAGDGGAVSESEQSEPGERANESNESKLTEFKLEKVDPAKFPEDEYDPETIGLVKSLRQTQDVLEVALKFIETQKQTVVQEAAQKNAQVFHDTLDSMPDEFGVSVKNGQPVKLTSEHEAARLKVRDAAETIYAGLISRKAAIPPLEDIINQAITMVNGVARKSSDRRQALQTQSAMRRSPGTTAAATRRKPVSVDGSPDSIASHPDIDRFWRQAQEANGVY